MPSKKKKYNARFPAGRIKKIMQTDEEVGKVAQAVPIIISRTLELFVESLLMKAMEITSAKNAKTLTPSHMKQCILSESRFDFLKDLVNDLPDVAACDSEDGALNATAQSSNIITKSDSTSRMRRQSDTSSNREDEERVPPTPLRMNPNFYKESEEPLIMQDSAVIPQQYVQAPTMVDEDYDT
ncbi:dr1-associated corepressor isoform X2 [Periplaneta americana]|uniref:dr1-associated corepressor isoform X2 n=1 Tax=Periplaneta americana TaxID=6978 RepID=UPI0037E8167C